MRKKIAVICVISAILLVFAVRLKLALALDSPSSSILIEKAKEYDGKDIKYKGEVVGEVMRRGNFAWVNLHDGENAIGVWVPVGLVKNIVYTGSYKDKGDIFEVYGVFNRSCTKHGGGLDIHAQTFTKVSSGRSVDEYIGAGKKNKALILFGVLLLWILIVLLRK
jgi:hypothetical protein